VAWSQSLAWELPYATGVGIKTHTHAHTFLRPLTGILIQPDQGCGPGMCIGTKFTVDSDAIIPVLCRT